MRVRLPVSSLTFPSPTASTLPRCGFSLAVSGRTIPLAVVSSSSTALTISRSPRGLSFIRRNLRESVAGNAVGTLAPRVPIRHPATRFGSRNRLVLRRPAGEEAIGDLLLALDDRREADHGDP